jgi:hypothetical protein
MQEIMIHKGRYRQQEIENLRVKSPASPRLGAKGWFCNAIIPGHAGSIRVYFSDESDFEVITTDNTSAQVKKSGATEEEIIARTEKRFAAMRMGVDSVVHGDLNGMIISGAPGIGKTETILQAVEQAASLSPVNYHVIKGNIVSAYQLHQLLYEFSADGDILILDDCDTILRNYDALNLLKSALETTSRVRRITYRSKGIQALNTPQAFDYAGSIIFITNENMQKSIDKKDTRFGQHFSALIDRTFYMDLMLHDRHDVYCRIKQMTLSGNLLGDFDISKDMQDEFLFWIKSNMEQIRTLSLRTMLHLAEIYRSDPVQWRTLAEMFILRN